MDRRVVVAGLVGLLLLVGSAEAQAQTQGNRAGPDPSGQGPVSLGSLGSISDTINGIPGMAGTTPPAASGLSPFSAPHATGAAQPRSPVGPEPVSLTPLSAIDPATDPRATAPGGISSLFRRRRPVTPTAPTAPPAAQAPRRASRPGGLAPKTDPAAVPSALPDSNPPGPFSDPSSSRTATTTIPTPAGRPAPFAGRVPDGPRPQADAKNGSETAAGRPAPLANERPRGPRPVAPTRTPRFQAPLTAPAQAPIPPVETAPAPPVVVPPPPPLIEPAGPEPSLPPVESPVEPAPPPLAAPAVPEPAPTQQADLPAQAQEPAPAPIPQAEATEPLPPTAVVAQAVSDPAVNRASTDSTALRITPPPRPRPTPFATLRAASVGDQVITLHELDVIVEDRFQQITSGQLVSDTERRTLKNELAASSLNELIEMNMIIQEAERPFKNNPKAKQQFDDFLEKRWREDELPPLLRSTATTNEYELKKKLAEKGKSYSDMKENFRKSLLAHDFLMTKIKNKVSADQIEMRAYYNEHLRDYEQPAQVTWREIEVNVAKYPDRAAARKQAEALAARLARREDFATLARTVSDGPTASQGGLYANMTPGGYGIPAVNDELNRLPTGQVSPIIEAPSSFHIIRVDARREAGPLRFDEVQAKIREEVFRRNFMKARTDYMVALRSRTMIRTMFDNTESDPARVRVQATR